MNITVKNLKINQKLSQETLCFSADICLNGKKVGECSNHGRGGNTNYHFTDRTIQSQCELYANSLPNEPKYNLKMDLELLLDTLVEDCDRKQHELKTYKRWCKNQVVFRLKNKTYKEGEWTTVKGVYTPALKAALETKYGKDNFDVILNETL